MKKSTALAVFITAVALIGLNMQAQAAEVKTKELRFGTIYADNTPTGLATVKFGQLLKEKTKGAYTAVHYPSEQLGTEQEMVESVGMGALDMSAPGSALCGLFQKQYLIFTVCYTIDDWVHLDKVMSSELGQEMSDKFLAATQARVLANNWFREPRFLYGSRPVPKLADLKGFRIRVPENPAWYKSWQRLGANPTPMALAETYSGIQTGALDGAETTLTYYTSNGIYAVAPHFMKTSHMYEANLCIITDSFFQSLTPELKQAFTEAAYEAGKLHQQYVEESLVNGYDFIVKNGGTVMEVDRENWIKQMAGLGDELWEIWNDKDLYKKVRSYSVSGK